MTDWQALKAYRGTYGISKVDWIALNLVTEAMVTAALAANDDWRPRARVRRNIALGILAGSYREWGSELKGNGRDLGKD